MHNLQTGYVSTQYYCVFDDFFETVFSYKLDTCMLDNICDEIFQDSYNWYAEDEYEDRKLVYFPLPLHGVWIKGPEYCDQRDNLIHQRQTTE